MREPKKQCSQEKVLEAKPYEQAGFTLSELRMLYVLMQRCEKAYGNLMRRRAEVLEYFRKSHPSGTVIPKEIHTPIEVELTGLCFQIYGSASFDRMREVCQTIDDLCHKMYHRSLEGGGTWTGCIIQAYESDPWACENITYFVVFLRMFFDWFVPRRDDIWKELEAKHMLPLNDVPE